jgi:hypothetical protein
LVTYSPVPTLVSPGVGGTTLVDVELPVDPPVVPLLTVLPFVALVAVCPAELPLVLLVLAVSLVSLLPAWVSERVPLEGPVVAPPPEPVPLEAPDVPPGPEAPPPLPHPIPATTSTNVIDIRMVIRLPHPGRPDRRRTVKLVG